MFSRQSSSCVVYQPSVVYITVPEAVSSHYAETVFREAFLITTKIPTKYGTTRTRKTRGPSDFHFEKFVNARRKFDFEN